MSRFNGQLVRSASPFLIKFRENFPLLSVFEWHDVRMFFRFRHDGIIEKGPWTSTVNQKLAKDVAEYNATLTDFITLPEQRTEPGKMHSSTTFS